uniref:Small ribosomal subunit protein uS3m n=1 Tax=Gymnascella citrina TaxID=37245 RepID=A0AA50KIE7_9EURO|nr:ribosomal protein S5 [Gymnascella citrina]WMB97493.1 ribosomal protein S5 [Gymnascella citrina]
MLNILKLKLKNSYKNVKVKNNNNNNKTSFLKKFEPSVRNWKNSIYAYNKNTLSLIPEASRLTIKLIKGYFNLYSLKLEKKFKKKSKKNLKLKKYSSHKIFISDGQFKHTNDLVNITIYFYNRQLKNYITKLRRRYIRIFKQKKYRFNKKLLLIKEKGLRYINIQNKKKNILKKQKILIWSNRSQRFITTKYQYVYLRRFIKKSFYKVLLFIYFRQLIFINESKFKNYYLQGLTNLIKKIYKKNIIFNFVNVKYFYLNSDIFTQSLLLKIRKNRRKFLKYIKTSILISKVKEIQYNPIVKYSLNLKALNRTNNLDMTNALLYDIFLQNKTKSNSLKEIVLNNINYKRLSGVRLEVGGRLTRRNTASRSISKKIYKGNLLNISSSEESNSFTLLRGSLRSNLEYTNLNSKIRNGTFGIKGWISGG